MKKYAGLMMMLLVGLLLGKTLNAQSQPAGTGSIRLAHFAANAARIDAYVDGQPFTNNLGAGDSTPLMNLPSGTHTLVIVAAGNTISQPLFAPVELDIQPNHRYSAAVIGQANHLKSLVMDETGLMSSPTATHEKLRVVTDSGGGMLKFKQADADDNMAAA